MVRGIPKEDLKLINDSFKPTGKAEATSKDGRGAVVKAARPVVNERGYTLHDFTGRVLKHNKCLIPVGGQQVVIGVKGQKYDDIPVESRKMVPWFPADFV